MRFILSLAMLAGCSTVQLEQPFESNLSEKLKDAISGNWEVDGDVLYIRFDQDLIKIAGVEWRDGSFTLEKGDGTLREINGQLFAAVRVYEDEKWSPYCLAKIILEGDTLLIQSPDVEQFVKLVKENRVEAHYDEGQKKFKTEKVIFEDLNQLDKLFSQNHDHLFNSPEGKVLKKLK